MEGLTIILVSVFFGPTMLIDCESRNLVLERFFFWYWVILQHSYLLNLLPQFTKEITSVVLWCVCKGSYTSTALARSRDLYWSMSHLKSSPNALMKCTSIWERSHLISTNLSPLFSFARTCSSLRTAEGLSHPAWHTKYLHAHIVSNNLCSFLGCGYSSFWTSSHLIWANTPDAKL